MKKRKTNKIPRPPVLSLKTKNMIIKYKVHILAKGEGRGELGGPVNSACLDQLIGTCESE